MSFGDIIGQMLQQGMAGPTRSRVEHSLGPNGLGAANNQGGLEAILGNLLGGKPGAAGSSSLAGGSSGGQSGGLSDLLGGLASAVTGGGQGGQRGGMSTAQIGGIGALAGALLGGGGGAAKGAIGGGALAMLGTLALSALKNYQQGAAATSSGLAEPPPVKVSEAEVERMVAPDTAEICLKTMIAAAKADGTIQDDEMQRIVGKLQDGGIDDSERKFVLEEMRKPLDVEALVAQIPDQQVAAQAYAAALMTIDVDTEGERAFLRRLAQGTGLDPQAVARLHQLTGAPA